MSSSPSLAWQVPRTPCGAIWRSRGLATTLITAAAREASNPPQRNILDAVVGAFAQDQPRPLPRRQNVLRQVLFVDGPPDLKRLRPGGIRSEMGIAMEIGARITERRLAQPHEARHVPFLDHLGVGVDVNREIEEIGDEWNGLAVLG